MPCSLPIFLRNAASALIVLMFALVVFAPSAFASCPDALTPSDDACSPCNMTGQGEGGGIEGSAPSANEEGNVAGGGDIAQGSQAVDGLVAVLNENRLLIRLTRQGDFGSESEQGENTVMGNGSSDETPTLPVGTPDGTPNENEHAGTGDIATYAAVLVSGGNHESGALIYRLGDGSIAEGGNVPWYEKRGAILSVAFGEGAQPRSMAYWFRDHDKLHDIDFVGLDTGRVTSMECLFAGCSSVTSLDLSSFNTSSVASMNGMFSGCASLEKVDLSSFDTRNVTDMSDMFSGCTNVKSLDLSSFDTKKVQRLDGMFSGCSSLAALDVSGFSANQLNAASIPTNNAGGYWRMNVPAGYDPGIRLREPSAEEREAAGLPVSSEPDGGNSNAGAESQGQTSSPASSEVSAATAAVADNVLNVISDADATSVANAIPSIAAALSGLAASIIEPVASLTLDPGLDAADVTAATESILDALGINAAVDKTMAMIAAALGMIAAAALVLALCFKIR